MRRIDQENVAVGAEFSHGDGAPSFRFSASRSVREVMPCAMGTRRMACMLIVGRAQAAFFIGDSEQIILGICMLFFGVQQLLV